MNRSPRTIASYNLAADQFAGWLTANDRPHDVRDLTADDVRGFIAYVLELGRASATARQRNASLRQLFKWLAEEGEIAADPMATVKPPKLIEQPIPVLDMDDLRAFIAAADGKDFAARRDEALLRLLADTGIRLAEISGLTLMTSTSTSGRPLSSARADGSDRRNSALPPPKPSIERET